MVHVGIHIGTSDTLVAVVAPSGQPTIQDVAGHWLVPFIIHVDSVTGRRSIGREALALWADPDADETGIFRRWRPQMGDGAVLRQTPISMAGGASTTEDITPERLTTWLVKYVLGSISDGVGGDEIESVVVAVPEQWRRESPKKCTAMTQAVSAARVAGAEVTVQPVTLSEPVAAAVYWLWEARQTQAGSQDTDDFVRKVVMVVDIGGSAFGLSLVRIGAPEEPLTVVSAVHNKYAGDYATALMLARVCRDFNDEHGTDLPTTAEHVLDALGRSDHPYLRQWFIDVEETFTHHLSSKISIAAKRNRHVPRPVVAEFRADDGREVEITVTAEEWQAELEPFYTHGRALVYELLEGVDESPYAVVFARGASRIAGVPERIVAPVLGADNPALNRIPFNENKVDLAVALGAALVAAGVVTVREKLLSDVGMIIDLPSERFRDALGITSDRILLTPMLRRGSDLPATFRGSEHQISGFSVAQGESTDFQVVIDDDPTDPFIQEWTVTHPAGGAKAQVEIALEADTDGRLSVTLVPTVNLGVPTSATGRLSSQRRWGSTFLVHAPGAPADLDIPRVTVEQLRKALQELRRAPATPRPTSTD
jgi:molecular chaperone DnaK